MGRVSLNKLKSVEEFVEEIISYTKVLPENPKPIDLFPWSNLKNKKKWKNKNRLRKKFIKHPLKYMSYNNIRKEYTQKILSKVMSIELEHVINREGIARRIFNVKEI